MPRILITGNGFDLGFGLPTSYNDFINIFEFLNQSDLNNPKIWNFSTVYKEIKNFDLLIQNFNQFEFEKNAIKKLTKKSLTNNWYNFFIQENSIQTWIDFENRIFYVLKLISKGIDLLKNKLLTSNTKQNEINKSHEFSILNDIEVIEILKLFKIIKIVNDDKDNDWDKSSFILKNNYFKIKYKHLIDIDSEKILKDIYKSLNEFIEIFIGYFTYFVLPIFNNYKGKDYANIFNKIDEHYTFNYTPTFEKIIKIPNITKFLHGKIVHEINENKIVLGINQIPAVENSSLYIKFTKTYQKLCLKTDYNFIRKHHKILSHSYTSEFQFIFWGHSLNVSDKKYIDEVFKFIDKVNALNKEIIVVYHSEQSRSELLINLINIRGESEIENLMKDEILKFYKVDSKELFSTLKRDLHNYNPTSSAMV